MNSDRPKILVLDFDGVLSSYASGWLGADVIPDPPVNGARAFCEQAVQYFNVQIVSSRCKYPGGSAAIEQWLEDHGFPSAVKVSQDGTKPAAFVTLDDRAIMFTGVWPDIEMLKNFKPWNKS